MRMAIKQQWEIVKQNWQQVQPWQVIVLIAVMHLAGLIGLSIPLTRPLFQALTPFNLVVATGLLLYFFEQKNKAFWINAGLVGLLGFAVEVVGVHTQLIFGQYDYGSTLGLKLWEVPLLIAVNWLMMVAMTGAMVANLPLGHLAQAALAATLMVILDFLIEPIAIVLDFWDWYLHEIPVQNFIAWWIVGFLLHYFFTPRFCRQPNPVAPWLYFIQFTFFLILYIFV